MRLHRAVILVLRIQIAREEMRLQQRKKVLARPQWSKIQILRKHAELFDASNHAFCYALRIVLNHRYVLLYWPHQYCARSPGRLRAITYLCKQESEVYMLKMRERTDVLFRRHSGLSLLQLVWKAILGLLTLQILTVAVLLVIAALGKQRKLEVSFSPSTLHGAMEESTV